MSVSLHDDRMPAVGDPGDHWEWTGPDGLTDSRRARLIDVWKRGSDDLTAHEEYLVMRHLEL